MNSIFFLLQIVNTFSMQFHNNFGAISMSHGIYAPLVTQSFLQFACGVFYVSKHDNFYTWLNNMSSTDSTNKVYHRASSNHSLFCLRKVLRGSIGSIRVYHRKIHKCLAGSFFNIKCALRRRQIVTGKAAMSFTEKSPLGQICFSRELKESWREAQFTLNGHGLPRAQTKWFRIHFTLKSSMTVNLTFTEFLLSGRCMAREFEREFSAKKKGEFVLIEQRIVRDEFSRFYFCTRRPQFTVFTDYRTTLGYENKAVTVLGKSQFVFEFQIMKQHFLHSLEDFFTNFARTYLFNPTILHKYLLCSLSHVSRFVLPLISSNIVRESQI